MATPQEIAGRGLWRGLKASAKSVRYRRGSGAGALSVEILAVPGRTEHEVVDDTGLVSTVHSQDWIVWAADLVLDDQVTLPKRNSDVVEELGEDGETVVATFQVAHPGGTEPFSYMSASRLLVRVHTIARS